jgi:acyl transferase domain-containing protein
MPIYHATGNSGAILANRISWFFDLKGPSVMIDTACSSSLVALDQACQALRLHQTSMVSLCLSSQNPLILMVGHSGRLQYN